MVCGLGLLILGGDSKFTPPFDEVFRSEGIKVIHTAIRAPPSSRGVNHDFGTLMPPCWNGRQRHVLCASRARVALASTS